MAEIPQEAVEAAAKAMRAWMQLPGWRTETSAEEVREIRANKKILHPSVVHSTEQWARVALEAAMPHLQGILIGQEG